MAWVLCVGLAVAGVSITAANFGREITLLYSLGLFLGTIYRCTAGHPEILRAFKRRSSHGSCNAAQL